MQDKKNITILIAEDDPGHAELIKDALEESGLKNEIKHFLDGVEVWEYLEKRATDNNGENVSGYLLLLDINMPRMDGVEVLKRIKKDEQLKKIPVIMLTTTDDPREIEECYKIGCNVYITKPVDFDKFSDTLKKLGLFVQIIKI